jgi:hypothetical protein
MELNQQSVDAHLKLLSDPKAYGLPFRPIEECFEKSETVTAKHILAKEFIENEVPSLHKLFCYIVMDKVFGLCDGKDEKGSLGYHLKFIKS